MRTAYRASTSSGLWPGRAADASHRLSRQFPGRYPDVVTAIVRSLAHHGHRVLSTTDAAGGAGLVGDVPRPTFGGPNGRLRIDIALPAVSQEVDRAGPIIVDGIAEPPGRAALGHRRSLGTELWKEGRRALEHVSEDAELLLAGEEPRKRGWRALGARTPGRPLAQRPPRSTSPRRQVHPPTCEDPLVPSPGAVGRCGLQARARRRRRDARGEGRAARGELIKRPKEPIRFGAAVGGDLEADPRSSSGCRWNRDLTRRPCGHSVLLDPLPDRDDSSIRRRRSQPLRARPTSCRSRSGRRKRVVHGRLVLAGIARPRMSDRGLRRWTSPLEQAR